MTYQQASEFAQTWGMLYMILMFGAVIVYALWPRNKDKFERAARQPLDEEK